MTKHGTIAMAHWRRLDLDGTDRCTLSRVEHGWMLTGHAVWEDQGETSLTYAVRCNEDWATLSADIAGTRAGQEIALRLIRDPSGWSLNGVAQTGTASCVDIDLSFTPATNLLPLRRLAFTTGKARTVCAAWLVPDLGKVRPLDQAYTRLDDDGFAYASANFEARLGVHTSGFVTQYPGLWDGWVDA